jgi:hypothetical protein
MRSLLFLLLILSLQAGAKTTVDSTWKITDSKLASELNRLYSQQRKAAMDGDVKTFTSLEHPYRLKQMSNNMAKMKVTLTPDILKMQAGAFKELKDPKFMKASPTAAILIYETHEPDQPKPNDRGYVAVEFLKEGSAWKMGTTSHFDYAAPPVLPDRMTLNPTFPPLATVQAPEFEGGFSYDAHGFAGSISVNGGAPKAIVAGQSEVGWFDGGYKKQNAVVITVKTDPKAKPWPGGNSVEVEFLTRGKSEMKSLLKKTYTKPGVYKESFAVAL